MKSTVNKLEGLNRKVTVEVPEEQVASAFNKVYKTLQKSASIKGFRKGKAPLSAVKTLYGDRVKGDVLQDIISEGYQSALMEHNLHPVNQPDFNFDVLEESQNFTFSAEFEVRPDVKLEKYEGLSVEKEKITINEEQVEKSLENIRTNRAEMTDVEESRPAQLKDTAIIDFEGFIAGEPLDGGKGEDHPLELGSNSFIPGFEDGIVGMNVGDAKEITLTFPEDYHAKEIAGKEVVFKVTLKKLQFKKLPELTDEFAKSFGEYDSLDAFKTAIKDEITKSEEHRVKEDLKNRVLHALVNANPVDVPASLLEQQKANLVEDVHRRMHQQGMNHEQFEEYKEKWDADFTDTATFMIQSNFLIDAIADKLELFPTEADIDAKLNEHALQTGLNVKQLKEYYAKDNRIANLRYQICEEKVVDHLIAKANIKEVEKDKLTPVK